MTREEHVEVLKAMGWTSISLPSIEDPAHAAEVRAWMASRRWSVSLEVTATSVSCDVLCDDRLVAYADVGVSEELDPTKRECKATLRAALGAIREAKNEG